MIEEQLGNWNYWIGKYANSSPMGRSKEEQRPSRGKTVSYNNYMLLPPSTRNTLKHMHTDISIYQTMQIYVVILCDLSVFVCFVFECYSLQIWVCQYVILTSPCLYMRLCCLPLEWDLMDIFTLFIFCCMAVLCT